MKSLFIDEGTILQRVQDILDWTDDLLKHAPLTAVQRDDLQAVQESAQRFQQDIAQLDQTQLSNSAEELQILRHGLKNHLNIIVGFTRIIIRDLPDNLLLHLATIRNIHEAGKQLMADVDNLR